MTLTWSPGFRRCVTSVNPDAPHYFCDTVECTGEQRWLVGVQAERDFAQACTGTNGQCLPINTGGPLSLTFEPYEGSNAVRLRTDLYNFKHPCAEGGQFTWFSFMENRGSGGGPMPTADRLTVHYRGIYWEVTGDQQGISRMGISWMGRWGGKVLAVDLNLYTHPHWGDGHVDEDILHAHEDANGIYVQMDGARMTPQYFVTNGQDASLIISVSELIQRLVARGYLPSPYEGESWQTDVIGVYTETYTPTRHKRSVASELLLYELQSFQ